MNWLAKIGAAALWIYTQHILVFTGAAILTAIECFVILSPYIVTPSPSYTLGVLTGLSAAVIAYLFPRIVEKIIEKRRKA